MSASVLAAIDDSIAAVPVLAVAQALGRSLRADVRALHVREGDLRTAADAAKAAGVPLEDVEGDPADCIVRASGRPEVEAVVVGARGRPGGRRPGGHVALAVIGRVQKPVVVVPPQRRATGSVALSRVLLPLEGTRASTEAVADTAGRLAGAGATLLALHVFDEATVPRFWDQMQHAGSSWAREFLLRWSATGADEVHLRVGDVPAAVLLAAEELHADLIALGWSQDLSPEHAHVVRDVLTQASVPVLLVPVDRP